MKIEIDKQTAATMCVVFALLIIQLMMSVFKVNYIINISTDIVLCLFLNIYNYNRFRHFQTKEDLHVANQRLAFASVFINLPFVIGITSILITLP